MVNCKLGNECERWINQHDMSMGQRKNLSPWQELNLGPPKHMAGALSTELRELMVPSWCRRHRTCHNRTLPHKPIVCIVLSVLLFSFVLESTVSSTPSKSRTNVEQGHLIEFIYDRCPAFCSPQVLIAQWIEHPPCVQEVVDSIPVGDSEFFFVPHSYHVG